MLQNKNLVKPQGKIFRNGYLLKTIWEAYEGLSPRLKFTPEIKYKKNSKNDGKHLVHHRTTLKVPVMSFLRADQFALALSTRPSHIQPSFLPSVKLSQRGDFYITKGALLKSE